MKGEAADKTRGGGGLTFATLYDAGHMVGVFRLLRPGDMKLRFEDPARSRMTSPLELSNLRTDG